MLKNKTYQKLLEQYIDGSINKSNLHKLEKAALDDPFLAEAMDGFDINANSAEAIKEIKSKLPKTQAKVIANPFGNVIYAVAASVALLIGVTMFIGNPLKNLNEDTAVMANQIENKEAKNNAEAGGFSKIEKEEPLVDAAKESDNQKPQIIKKPSASILKAKKVKTKQKNPISKPQKVDLIEKNPIAERQAPNPNIKEEVTTQTDYQPNIKGNTDEDFDSDLIADIETSMPANEILEESEGLKKAEVSEEVVSNKTKKTNDYPSDLAQAQIYNDYMVKGFIYDNRFNPLPGATLKIIGQSTEYKVDDTGMFAFEMNEEFPTILVSHEGYHETTFVPKIAVKNQVTLEKIIIPVEKEKKVTDKKIMHYPTYDNGIVAAPKIGAIEFENLLLNIDNKEYGKVEVEFEIEKSGKIGFFRILDSDCEPCEKQAIELLKNTGRWITIPAFKEVKIALTMDFGE